MKPPPKAWLEGCLPTMSSMVRITPYASVPIYCVFRTEEEATLFVRLVNASDLRRQSWSHTLTTIPEVIHEWSLLNPDLSKRIPAAALEVRVSGVVRLNPFALCIVCTLDLNANISRLRSSFAAPKCRHGRSASSCTTRSIPKGFLSTRRNRPLASRTCYMTQRKERGMSTWARRRTAKPTLPWWRARRGGPK